MGPERCSVFPQRATVGHVIGLPPEPGLVSTPCTEGKGDGALRLSSFVGACHRQSIGAAHQTATPKGVCQRSNLGGRLWRVC